MSSLDCSNYPESLRYKIKNKDEQYKMSVIRRETEMVSTIDHGLWFDESHNLVNLLHQYRIKVKLKI